MMKKPALICLAFLAATALVFAQRGGGGRGISVSEDVHTAREIGTRSVGTPMWTNAPGFEKDVFTYARIRYDKNPDGPKGRGLGGWTTDLPDSDLNLSYRLQQMTSMKVDPDG